MAILLLFAAFLLLLVIEVPVAIALLLSSLAYIDLASPLPIQIVVQRMASGLDSFPLIAIPLFVLAGNILNGAGIAERIYAFAVALVGHVRGGLAQVNIFGSMVFAGMSGVAQADAAGLGTIEIKHMKERGYSAPFAAACTAASAIIGPVIPPSVIMVVYAVTAQVSLTQLFLAGIIPGLTMGLSLMILVWVLAATGRVVAPTEPRANIPFIMTSFWRALPALVAPIFLTAGMLLGFATPTELGALTVIYAIILGFWTRDLTVASLMMHIRQSAVTSGILTLIIASAVPFGWIISVGNYTSGLLEFFESIGANWVVFLLIVNVALLIVGLFIETTAVLLIATPALLPLAAAYGIDPIHLGVIMIVNLLIGAITPPMGVILFICQHIANIRFSQMVRAILPFYIPLGLMLLVITYWSPIVMWLPTYFR
ncbi:TRAP transporter large permease [Aureimonas frigidaquae]|uniref:TRAP transporter large permease protein n=1 Tax=Aureimonas frigidaquae TaxID=424757 RepID=A0A0P0Z442_9HYPH|nr:TRAP transporter large permease [Aureimonas frigidaquae]BAT28592.1 TRAP-type transport system permease large protein [Aureimonas frigidaquae]